MIVQLEGEGFRNLTHLSLGFEPGSHLFQGTNGAGKTSLLEAIYLLATTRSFRTSQIGDCGTHERGSFRLRAEVDRDRRARLELGWQDRRSWRTVNGDRTSLAEHLEVLPIVCWNSSDVELLSGPPAGRRQFLDRGVVSQKPAAITLITRYRQAVQEKRQLLLQGGREIDTWNSVLASAAADLIRWRSLYAEDLAAALERVLADAELGLPSISLHYRYSPRCGLEGVGAIEEELAALSHREIAAQRLLVGPHRDDLEILWDGHPIRRVASAGERKALGLSLLAAQGRILEAVSRSPVYLLDDADAELDGGRLERLWSVFRSRRQVFATSSRPHVWKGLEINNLWNLEAGKVQSGTP